MLYNRDVRLQCLLMSSSTFLAVLPILFVINSYSNTAVYPMSFVGGFVVNMNGPNVRAILQNVCVPELRGTAFSVFTLTDDIGKGLGPALVVLIIQSYQGDRRTAFNVVTLFWLICGFLLFLLIFTVPDDILQVQAAVRQALLRQHSRNSDSYQSQSSLPDSPTCSFSKSPLVASATSANVFHQSVIESISHSSRYAQVIETSNTDSEFQMCNSNSSCVNKSIQVKAIRETTCKI